MDVPVMREGRDNDSTTVATDGGFEWQTDANSTRQASTAGVITRTRLAIAGTIVLVVVAAMVLLSGSSYAHTTFTANDVTVTGNSGQLKSFTIAPEGDVHYDGLEAEPTGVEVTVSTKLSSSSTWETVSTKSLSASGLEGSVNYSFAATDLLKSTSFKKKDFRSADGSTKSTDVDVRVEVTLIGAGPGGANVTTTSTDTLSVSVTNEEAGANVGGKANSGGSSA